MKKIVLCIGLFSFLMITSCEKKTQQTETTETTETTTTGTTDTDTIVVKQEAPKEEGTSVKIGDDGIDVNSKDVDVEIKK